MRENRTYGLMRGKGVLDITLPSLRYWFKLNRFSLSIALVCQDLIFGFFPLFLQQMFPDDTRKKIEDITAGIIIKGQQDNCTTIRNLLCAGFPTSTTVKTDFEGKAIVKEEQALLLEIYSNENSLWHTDLPGEDRYLTRGGEALVYLDPDSKTVVKLNDAVYYATWLGVF